MNGVARYLDDPPSLPDKLQRTGRDGAYNSKGNCQGIRSEDRGCPVLGIPPERDKPLLRGDGAAHQICHSTKRTHRFLVGKQDLSICDTMSYTIKIWEKYLGSFSETNPIWRGFGGGRTRKSECFGVRNGECILRCRRSQTAATAEGKWRKKCASLRNEPELFVI
jgi:hypothetical protein